MNVYQKLAKARVELGNRELKKSGFNQFNNFKYFELKDFLPEVNAIFNELGLCSVVSFGDKAFAVLKIFNSEKPEEMLEFSSPMVEQGLTKGSSAIQNIGAVQTYQRRYLYMTALEISENDWVDAQDNRPETKLQPQEKTQQQLQPRQQPQQQPVNNPASILAAFTKNADKAQSYEELKAFFGEVYTLLKGTPQQQQAKDYYEVRKAEFEQENL